MLEDRATALKKYNFDKVKKIEKKMTDYKNDNFDELMRPQCAIVIF